MANVGGPSANVARSSVKGASIFHFMRVLQFAKPYMRYLYPALACIFLVAFTYSLNILAILPVIKVIAGEQGLPSWVHQNVVESRLQIDFKEPQPDDRKLMIIKIHSDSPLMDSADVGHVVVGTDLTDSNEPRDILAALAYADADTTATLILDNGDRSSVTLRPVPFYLKLGMRGATYFPQGDTKSDKMWTLGIVIVGTLVIGLIGAVCRFYGEYLIAIVAGRSIVAMRRRMYDHVLQMPMAEFASRGVSDLISRFVQDSQDVYRGLVFVFAKTLREPLKAVFVLIVAIKLDYRITLITLAITPLAAYVIRKFGKIIRKNNKRLYAAYGRMLASLDGSLKGIRVVKGYSMENYERRHLYDVDQKMLKLMLRIEKAEALSSPVFEMIGRFAATFAIMYFAHLMFEGSMSFSRFATLAACMAATFDPIRKMSSFYNRIQRANAALDRVFEVFEMPIHDPGDKGKPTLPIISEGITFEDVVFTYPGAESPAVDSISLHVARGERVAFVGPNGSGKTTLLSLLMRFFDPESGRILFDGCDVRDYTLASLRRQMSLITQDSVIFADTIANNIAYGDEQLIRRIVLQRRHPERNYHLDGQDARIEEAAKAAYAHDFIMEKPEQYDTFVAEQGATLSGGQKQRIAIARAILRNAPIFIFDEATSQVDAESEHKIHEAVEKFLEGRTAFIIAHRFSTILQADRIVVMDRGRILDSGRHDELIKRCELYQALYGSQILKDEATTSS
ncbi:MAG: ABC transporter ATP-binding protein [Phycisphaerales bacterium]|nr:ABC transporter ATP-binding protein [Phycisphaerales bacterium]